MPKKPDLFFKFIPFYLVVIFIFGFPVLQKYLISKNTAKAKPIQSVSIIEGNPVRITIPIAQIDLSIVNGDYNKNSKSWTLSPIKALFAVASALPNNQEGNTLIYGHDTNAVFYGTFKLTAGDEAFLYTDNGRTFIYKLINSEVVEPGNVSVFDYKGSPRLTLQTCSGIFSQNRKLFYFNLEKVI